MAQPYPLYDELLRRVKERLDKGIDVEIVRSTINNISLTLNTANALEHYTEIAALIYHHGVLENGMLLTSIPYETKTMISGKGILGNMANLPPMLQQIIAQYIQDEAYPELR